MPHAMPFRTRTARDGSIWNGPGAVSAPPGFPEKCELPAVSSARACIGRGHGGRFPQPPTLLCCAVVRVLWAPIVTGSGGVLVGPSGTANALASRRRFDAKWTAVTTRCACWFGHARSASRPHAIPTTNRVGKQQVLGGSRRYRSEWAVQSLEWRATTLGWAGIWKGGA